MSLPASPRRSTRSLHASDQSQRYCKPVAKVVYFLTPWLGKSSPDDNGQLRGSERVKPRHSAVKDSGPADWFPVIAGDSGEMEV